MVRAWFIDEDPKYPKEEHHRCPPKFIGLDELYKTTGVEYFEVSANILIVIRNNSN